MAVFQHICNTGPILSTLYPLLCYFCTALGIYTKILDFFFSMKLMVLLLLAFAASIGAATFIEAEYDTAAAKILVFNATWFEMMLVVLMINLIGGMLKYNLFRKEKLSQLSFHLSFILILLGAGVSRFVGYEGTMIIQEGTSSNEMLTAEHYVQAFVGTAEKGLKPYRVQKWFSEGTPWHNEFEYEFKVSGKPMVKMKYLDYMTDVVYDVLSPGKKGQEVVLIQVPLPEGGGMDTMYIRSGQIRAVGDMLISFNNSDRTDAIQLRSDNKGAVRVFSPFDMLRLDQDKIKDNPGVPPMSLRDTLVRDKEHELQFRMVHMIGNFSFVYKAHFDDVRLGFRKAREQGTGSNFLQVELKHGKEKRMALLPYKGKRIGKTTFYETIFSDGVMARVGYGSIIRELDFKIRCKDFRLETYPGTVGFDSPSSFECDVVIEDPDNDVELEANIFMNHVLDYRGYRFFQSQYNWSSDEKFRNGEEPDVTVLSVNHDMPGTIITYIGYLIMALGFIWTMFRRGSRFRLLGKKAVKLSKERKKRAGLTILLTLISVGSWAQPKQETNVDKELDKDFVDLCETMVVQNSRGRVNTFQTHAIDVLYKVYKKRSYKGSSASEVYLKMLANPVVWYTEPIIMVGEEARDFMGIEGKYASVKDFLDMEAAAQGGLVVRKDLIEAYQEAHKIRDVDKNGFHKEIIKTFDRYYVLRNTLSGQMFQAYPAKETRNEFWLATVHLKNEMYPGKDAAYITELDASFRAELNTAINTGKYEAATKKVEEIIKYQREEGGDIVPSETMISMENLYNDLNIFFYLMMIYTILGFIFLVAAILEIVSPEPGIVHWVVMTLTGLLLFYALAWLIKTLFLKNKTPLAILKWPIPYMVMLAMALHVFGLGLRWYITGHAPWSNGYEALVWIGFGTMLAGLIFYRWAEITIGAAGLLAGLILGVAHGASTDPELTNLVPVLKSVWLVIHVAIITSSYGFLGLGAILSLINLLLYTMRTNSNKKRANLAIQEMTVISELTMNVGLYMAAIGTFLGGVWANESWGRYWGWDPKETWALVIVLTYAILLHIRFIPFMKSRLLFSILGLWAFSTVIMTYFGVNYYLGIGLHSYARGDKSYLPMWAQITIVVLAALTFVAAWRDWSYRKESKPAVIDV